MHVARAQSMVQNVQNMQRMQAQSMIQNMQNTAMMSAASAGLASAQMGANAV